MGTCARELVRFGLSTLADRRGSGGRIKVTFNADTSGPPLPPLHLANLVLDLSRLIAMDPATKQFISDGAIRLMGMSESVLVEYVSTIGELNRLRPPSLPTSLELASTD